MRGKKISFNVVHAYSLFVKYRIREKLPVELCVNRIADEMGMKRNTLKVRVMREGWSNQMAELLPAVTPIIPTSTTAHEVIDATRKKYLAASDLLYEQWIEGMVYLKDQFDRAKLERNYDRAYEVLTKINHFALTLLRAQQVSCHATCDSGSALAPSTGGAPDTDCQIPPIRILLAREIANPRIPQPPPEPRSINLRVENKE